MRTAALLALLSALLLAPAASAAINGPIPFETDLPFGAGFGPDSGITLVSGTVEAAPTSDNGVHGFLDARGLRIDGVQRACWENDCASGDLSLEVSEDGSVALRFPVATSGGLDGAHAAAFFVDWAGNEDLADMGLGKSLVALLVDGRYAFDAIAPFQAQGIPDESDSAVLAPFSNSTTVTVLDGGEPVATVGSDQAIVFDGAPVVQPFTLGVGVLPFEAGAQASFTPADPDDTQAGLDLSRLEQALAADDAGDGEGAPEIPDGLSGILSSTAAHIPPQTTDVSGLLEEGVFLRYDELTVMSDGATLAWTGAAPLQVQQGEVVDADPLVFLWPWWAYLLWGLAIAGFVARRVLKVPTEHERWDRFRWVGLVGGLVASILVFFLWDLEVRAVWGVSLLSGAGSGGGLAAIAALQLIPLALVGLGIGLPVQSLLKSGTLLAQQGTLAGANRIVGPFVMFLLGATLILDYIGLLLDRAGSLLGA